MSERLSGSIGRLGNHTLQTEQLTPNHPPSNPSDQPPKTDSQGKGVNADSTERTIETERYADGPSDASTHLHDHSAKGAPSPTAIPVDGVILMLHGTLNFQSSRKDFVELQHGDDLAINEGTLTMWFNAQQTWGRKSLFSKDAANGSQVGHLTVWVHDGRIEARLASRHKNVTVQTTYGSVAARRDCFLAVTFGSSGFRVYLDGVLAAAQPTFTQGWAENTENLLIGASGWRRKPAKPLDVRDYFDGQIADTTIFNRQLRVPELKKQCDARR